MLRYEELPSVLHEWERYGERCRANAEKRRAAVAASWALPPAVRESIQAAAFSAWAESHDSAWKQYAADWDANQAEGVR